MRPSRSARGRWAARLASTRKGTDVSENRWILVRLFACSVISACSIPAPSPATLPSESATASPTKVPTTSTPSPTATRTPYPTPDLRPGSLLVQIHFPGLEQQGRVRADLNIAASPGVVVLTSNDELAILDKTGGLIAAGDLRSFFRPVLTADNEDVVDPRLSFDTASGRFLLSAKAHFLEDAECFPICPTAIVLAVSRTSDPDAFDPNQWIMHRLDAKVEYNVTGANKVEPNSTPDFDSLATTDNFVVISYQVNRASDEQNLHSVLRVVPKEDMLSDEADIKWRDITLQKDATGTYPLFLPALGDPDADSLYLVDMQFGACRILVGRLDASTLELAIRSIPFTPCQYPPSAAQPSGPPFQFEAGVRERPSYHSGSLWLASTITHIGALGPTAAVMILELDVSSWPQIGTNQRLIVADDHVDNFLPALAVAPNSDVIAVFSCSGREMFLAICATGRLGSDPLGELRPVSVLRQGIGSLDFGFLDGSNPFEDYPGAWLDPDLQTVWVTAALQTDFPDVQNDRWYSWVFRIRLE